jgi:hypothetical protein
MTPETPSRWQSTLADSLERSRFHHTKVGSNRCKLKVRVASTLKEQDIPPDPAELTESLSSSNYPEAADLVEYSAVSKFQARLTHQYGLQTGPGGRVGGSGRGG